MSSSISQSPAAENDSAGETTAKPPGDARWHVAFGVILIGALAAFIPWTLGYVGDTSAVVLLILVVLLGVFMAFTIGGNDVANSFGTSVGAGTLSMKQALLVAAVFEVSGAIIAGGEVTDTVKSGIVELDTISHSPMDFVFIMMSALVGAAAWLLFATRMGWPVSTTHSIVGGIVGAALCIGFTTGSGGFDMVQWSEIWKIVISWVLSPLLGGIVAFILFGLIKRHILRYNEEADAAMRELKLKRIEHRRRERSAFERLSEIQQIAYTNAMARDSATVRTADYDRDELESTYYRDLHDIEKQAQDVESHRAIEVWVPLLAAFGSMIIGSMLLVKGLKNLELNVSPLVTALMLGMVGATVWMAVFIFAKSMKKYDLDRTTFLLFSWMQVFTASAFAFSHGSNDIANALGPFAAVLDVLRTGRVGEEAVIPTPVMITFGIGLIAGLWFIGRRVIATVGSGLTRMHPSSGFAAELAAAAVVMSASSLGLPVSSTHILIGAVLGVGLVNKAANWSLMRPIALAWVVTLPAAALIGAVAVWILRVVFG
ncbi:inorganic phosphate transporter [Helcobacillus massiliensis]|uniref:Phosphate transporter n=1 Tax=Helcobacillus massiliensis TaxID=521392 RepID=A0A839QTP7_9MICO|nr:inorganic phosphate transporter [Helcobacillus massiliensis]MBB3023442.1 PiT family inorganic phosphate transporter [Helcobacillus massiliensis]